MNTLDGAVDQILGAPGRIGKPLAIVLAGHNGSGKSTMWRLYLSDKLRIPLINADRMMMSILPEPNSEGRLPPWAQSLRDTDRAWMGIAQQGVLAFVAQAVGAKASFAMETVFSHWRENADGSVSSKIDLIREMQAAGYFVLLMFVGLASDNLSIFRVETRVARGGHDVDKTILRRRFPRTQKAIQAALEVADGSILTDNSRGERQAFTIARAQLGRKVLYDIRAQKDPPPRIITAWMDAVAPRDA